MKHTIFLEHNIDNKKPKVNEERRPAINQNNKTYIAKKHFPWYNIKLKPINILCHYQKINSILTLNGRIIRIRLPRVAKCSLYFLTAGLITTYGINVSAQIQSTQQQSAGTKDTFSYSITAQYGVQTSGSANPNMTVNNEAILKISPGSTITNKFGDLSGQSRVQFDSTTNSANVAINGLTGQNNWIIQQADFKSILKNIDNPDPSIPSIGSGSATGIHTTTVTIEKSQSSFSNSYNQSF